MIAVQESSPLRRSVQQVCSSFLPGNFAHLEKLLDGSGARTSNRVAVEERDRLPQYLVDTRVNTLGTMFPDSGPMNTRFPRSRLRDHNGAGRASCRHPAKTVSIRRLDANPL